MSDDKTKAAALLKFTQYMKLHRLRKTPERYAILEKVFDMTDHFFIDSLYADLEKEGYHVSRGTVYNTMELLINAGLVRRHVFGNQSAQYEKIAGPSNHHHLVCSRCGKVKEIKDPELDRLLDTRDYGTFHMAYTDLYIYGTCARCNKKKSRKITHK